jgi:uncharacterized protein (TIGR02145 family)
MIRSVHIQVMRTTFSAGLLMWMNGLCAQVPCGYNPDFNGDLTIGTADLLSILNLWSESDSDADGVWDSQDDCVGVYDACGVCNGSGEDLDSDGMCDDADSCVGALDVCGVCNGPGPSVPVIDQIIYVTDSIYVPPLTSWYVFTYATDTLYTYVCPVLGCMDANALNFNSLAVIENGSCSYGPAQCDGLSTVTFDGHTYALVGIGTQCWFAENLRTDKYRNGDPIPGNLSSSQWSNTTSGAQAVFNENSSYLETYGRLYNWYAVSDPRGLCPSGWSVPSDESWRMLEIHLGMTVEQSHSLYWRGTDQGAQIKSSPLDNPPWDGTNSSGFAALPGGYRGYYGGGTFWWLGTNAVWWTSTSVGQQALNRLLDPAVNTIFRNTYDMNDGFSVRCLKD